MPGHAAQPTRTDPRFVSDTGPPHQQQEVPIRAITGDCVSGLNNFIHCNASVTIQGGSDSDPTRGQANAFQNSGVRTEISSLCEHDKGSETDNPGCSIVSSPLTSSDKQSGTPGIILRGSATELSSGSRDIKGGLTGTIVWWMQEMQNYNKAPLLVDPPNLVIESNASCLDWGATLKGQELRTGGQWLTSEQEMHINCLELLAASLAIQTFAKERQNINILVRTDNVSARECINHFGGAHSGWIIQLHRSLTVLDSSSAT